MTCNQNCQQGRACDCVDLVARLRDHVPYYEIEGEAADEIERLTAELAACKKDAERYRWLRDSHNNYSPYCGLHVRSEFNDIPEELDSAIDKAMKESNRD